jgi:UDPglucose--hexose-1-phosphate uridylyltransferase
MVKENELRRHPLLNEWVVIAEIRSKRPKDFKFYRKRFKLKSFDKKCPFCVGNENQTPKEIGRIGGKVWSKRVFPNKFAAITPNQEFKFLRQNLLESTTAFGYHEIIVETNKHNQRLSQISLKEFKELLELYAMRFKALKRKKNVKEILIIKNYGVECGASLMHEHSQIASIPFESPIMQEEKKTAKKFYLKTGKCIFCELNKKEFKERGIKENNSFYLFTPFCSRWPFETIISSKRHASNLLEFNNKELKDLAFLMKWILKKYFKKFNDPPYNFVLRQSIQKSKYYHFRVEFFPNLQKIYGGIEKGARIILNEVSPERAAKELRKN